MQEFDLWLKLNSLVLRHMTISLDQKPDKYIEKSISVEKTEVENTELPLTNNETESDVQESHNSKDIEKDKEQ